MEPELPFREYGEELSSRLHRSNNYSILSKYSASKHGYFKDEYLEDFVDTELKPKFRRRTPLVNRGYAARMKAVQWAVYRQTSVQCLIILGAGYDMLSLHYTREFECHCIEIDFPEVIETKKEYLIRKFDIQETDIKQIYPSTYSFPKLKIHLISCDIRSGPDLSMKLNVVFENIPDNERKLMAVLNEVCLCYLKPLEVKNILSTIKLNLEHNNSTVMTYIGYEPLRSSKNDAFSMLMEEHFCSMDFELKHFPTSAELEDLFKNQLNFQYFSLTSMHHIFHRTLSDWHKEIDFASLEPFDEFEEMDLYLRHYALVVAAIDLNLKTSCLNKSLPQSSGTNVATDELGARIGSYMSIRQSRERVSSQMNKYVMRYGHASCLLNGTPGSQSILVNGGFGMGLCSEGELLEGQHKRLSDWFILHRRSDGWKAQPLKPERCDQTSIQFTRMHAQVCLLSGSIVMINGGRESPTPRTYPSSNLLALVNVRKSSLMCVSASYLKKEVRWRHRSLPIPAGIYSQNGIIEVGGKVAFPTGHEEETSNVGSVWVRRGEVHSGYLTMNNEDGVGNDYLFARHSFGMDFKDSNTLMVFGGLNSVTDRPINASHGAVTLDMRISPLTPPAVSILGYSTPYYDNQVHFINDNQFVNMGGVSTLTGEVNNYIELYDLRKTNQKEPIFKEPLQPIMEDPGERERRLFPTKQTSVNFKESSEIVTIGGGGNYFTFGTHFNRYALVYSYSDLRCGEVGEGKAEIVKQPNATGGA